MGKYDSYVHEGSNGRFYVAELKNGQYIGEMTYEQRKLTGCGQIFCGYKDLVGSGIRNFVSKKNARRLAKQLYFGY